MAPSPQVRQFNDPPRLFTHAARFVIQCARRGIAERGRFTLALSGGSTPVGLHELLASPDVAGKIDWNKVLVFWGDDRMVPADSEYSNFRMGRKTLLSRIPIPARNVFPMPTEETCDTAAKTYESVLRANVGDAPFLDLCILGMGSDGHTASLFPGSPLLDETARLVACEPSPGMKPDIPRLTLTLPMINNSTDVLFLAMGKGKKSLVDEILNTPREAAEKYPAARVRARGATLWLIA